MLTMVLGESLNGIQEVSGSIPLISTKGYAKRLVFVRKQAFSLFYDEIGISLPSQSLPRGGVPCERPPFFVSQVGTNLNWKNMSHQSFHNSNTSYSGGLIKSCATFFIMSI